MADAPETTFGINALAQSLGRSIVSIRRLERNGVLPPATRVHGRRRYSAADIERMRRAAEETGFREHPDRLDAFRAALHAQEPEPLNIRDIAPPEAWADLEDREPQPQVRGWADMGGDEDGGDGWRPASPAAATRPACPACEGLVHQVTDQYQRLVWMCGRDGLVRRPLRIPAASSRGQLAFVAPAPVESGRARARSLRMGNVVGAIRAPRPQPKAVAGYLEPRDMATRPMR